MALVATVAYWRGARRGGVEEHASTGAICAGFKLMMRLLRCMRAGSGQESCDPRVAMTTSAHRNPAAFTMKSLQDKPVDIPEERPSGD